MYRHCPAILMTTLILHVIAASDAIAQQDGVETAMRASEAFVAEEYREAAILMLEAYELLEDYQIPTRPILVYNAARSFQEDGRCVMSHRYFNEFLDLYATIDFVTFGDENDVQQFAEAQTRSVHDLSEASLCQEEYREFVGLAESALIAGDPETAATLFSSALSRSDEPATRIHYSRTLILVGGPSCENAVAYLTEQIDEVDLTDIQRAEMESNLREAIDCLHLNLPSDDPPVEEPTSAPHDSATQD